MGDPDFFVIWCVVLTLPIFWQPIDAATCDSPDAAWIFCEDFETKDLSSWDDSTRSLDQYRTIINDPGPADEQNNSVFRLRIPEGPGGNSINKTFSPDEYDVLYARWYIAYETGFDFTAKNHGFGLHAGDRWSKGVAGRRPQGNDWFTAQVEIAPISESIPVPRNYIYAYYRGMGMDCTDPNGACWGDHIPCMISDYYCNRTPAFRVSTTPPRLEQEVWYCVEMMLDAGNSVPYSDEANGKLNFWVNNLEIGPWENMWFRTTASVRINHFWLGLFHHEEHSTKGLKFDDVIVSTSRIGC